MASVSAPFIDVLLFNYIHAFCVGSLCLRLCVHDRRRDSDARQRDFDEEERAYEVFLSCLPCCLFPLLFICDHLYFDTSLPAYFSVQALQLKEILYLLIEQPLTAA